MSLVGAGYGAATTLDQILQEALQLQEIEERKKESEALMAQRRNESAARSADAAAERELRGREINLRELQRRDESNRHGLELMTQDRGRMDTDAAVANLPSHLRHLGPLMSAGFVRSMSPSDLEDPEQREAREIRIRQSSIAPRQAEEKKPLVVKMPDGSVKDINNVLPPGAVPYDQVAARSSQPQNDEAIDTAREAKRIATALRNHKGLGGAFGVLDQYLPTLRQPSADAVALRDALTSLLTLENTGKLKGVLSNADMQVLRQASTTLAPGMSEGAARTELDRIIEVMGRVAGDAPDGTNGVTTGDELDALINRLRTPRGQQ